jgi:hypothetical protein
MNELRSHWAGAREMAAGLDAERAKPRACADLDELFVRIPGKDL